VLGHHDPHQAFPVARLEADRHHGLCLVWSDDVHGVHRGALFRAGIGYLDGHGSGAISAYAHHGRPVHATSGGGYGQNAAGGSGGSKVGYLVAWQNPALRAMYDNGSNPAVFNAARLIPLQLFRSVLWAMFGLPVIRGTRGPAWQVGIVVGLLYALPMNIVHILPNPFMPDPTARLSHFIKTATSNFILGLCVTWLLHRRHNSIKDLLGMNRRAEGKRPVRLNLSDT
jgi:hypothetical protein